MRFLLQPVHMNLMDTPFQGAQCVGGALRALHGHIMAELLDENSILHLLEFFHRHLQHQVGDIRGRGTAQRTALHEGVISILVVGWGVN